jgi:hypothetical protein
MQYRDQKIRYDSDRDELEAELLWQQHEVKRHPRKRFAKPKPRRVTKSAQHGYGIARRRIHRLTW